MFETGNLKIEHSEGLKCGYGLNWYIYANNNPLRFVDPTGLRPIDDVGSGVTYNENNKTFSYENGSRVPDDAITADVTRDVYEGYTGEELGYAAGDKNKYYTDQLQINIALPDGGSKNLLTTQVQSTKDLSAGEGQTMPSGDYKSLYYSYSNGPIGSIYNPPLEGEKHNYRIHTPAAMFGDRATKKWSDEIKAGGEMGVKENWLWKPGSGGCIVGITGSEQMRTSNFQSDVLGYKSGVTNFNTRIRDVSSYMSTAPRNSAQNMFSVEQTGNLKYAYRK